MNADIFAPGFKAAPFWWERTPRPVFGGGDGGAPHCDSGDGGDAGDGTHSDSGDGGGDGAAALPAACDVLIIGSGYTGLSAAIQTARAGRRTVVVDAEAAGFGCSSRNGGQVSTSLKPTFPRLAKRYGAAAAHAILREGNHALEWIESFVRDNHIDCDFRRVGRFHGAHSPRAFKALQQKIADIPSALNIDAYPVAPDEVRAEVATDVYHGGVIYPRHACIDPGRYHQGLLTCALNTGAQVVTHCKVHNITRDKTSAKQFTVDTTRGRIVADDVLIATSGYTGAATPWWRRRIIPIGSYMIATEELPVEVMAQLIPRNRVVTDTRKLVVFYRTCPARRRILFGGRVSLRETDARRSAVLLHQQMTDLFPQLVHARVTHSWFGFVGYSFDETPHIGVHDGVHYSMGYCGSGISLASYFGMRAGLKLIDDARGATALDNLTFPARAYYRGNPWFLAPTIAYYRWRDAREQRTAQTSRR